MGMQLRSWWQKIKQHWVAMMIGAIVLVVAIVLIVVGYRFDWTGFPRKTLWDWLQLLIIPLVLALVALLFNLANSRTERQIALDNQRETALQAYIDKMSELLLHEKLRESGKDDEVRTIARVRTLTLLWRLDGQRKGSVLKFLYESGLIHKDKQIIFMSNVDLSGAILSGANLGRAVLSEADLSGAILSDANLSGADLSGADLSVVDLSGADLSGASLGGANLGISDLSGADLSAAYLLEAGVTTEQLAKAKSLKGTTMPDGSKHP